MKFNYLFINLFPKLVWEFVAGGSQEITEENRAILEAGDAWPNSPIGRQKHASFPGYLHIYLWYFGWILKEK